MSSLLIQVAKSPEPSCSPRLIAALCPPSGSLTHVFSHGAYFLMISTDPSVLPPSMTKYSRFGYPCSRIDRSVASRNRAWLNDGVTTLMRGQARAIWHVSAAAVCSLRSTASRLLLPGGAAVRSS